MTVSIGRSDVPLIKLAYQYGAMMDQEQVSLATGIHRRLKERSSNSKYAKASATVELVSKLERMDDSSSGHSLI
jgi:hypothetical protein